MCPGWWLSLTPDTWAEKFESFERINSIRETNGNFDSCISCKRLGTSRLHDLHESKFPFVSRIEFIRSKLSNFSAHVYGVNGHLWGMYRYRGVWRSPEPSLSQDRDGGASPTCRSTRWKGSRVWCCQAFCIKWYTRQNKLRDMKISRNDDVLILQLCNYERGRAASPPLHYGRKVRMSGRPTANLQTVFFVQCHHPINFAWDRHRNSTAPATVRGTCRVRGVTVTLSSITPRQLARLRPILMCV